MFSLDIHCTLYNFLWGLPRAHVLSLLNLTSFRKTHDCDRKRSNLLYRGFDSNRCIHLKQIICINSKVPWFGFDNDLISALVPIHGGLQNIHVSEDWERGLRDLHSVCWFISVSDPYSLNPDTDPAKNLNPDPSYFLPLSDFFLLLHNYKIFSSKEVN